MSTEIFQEARCIILPDPLRGGVAMAKTAVETIGERIARLRKERGITQKELADLLRVTQPVVSDYERGELRVHGELLVRLAEILRVSANEILGLEKNGKTEAAVKNRRLQRRLQAIDKLPKRDQEALLRTIDAFLSKAG